MRVPIIAVALMLMSQRARLNGPVFVIGWLVGLAVIGVVVLAIAGPADSGSNGEPATWSSVLKLVLGLLLVLLAIGAAAATAQTGIGATDQAIAISVFSM